MTDLKFNADGLGTWTEPQTFEVTRERLAEYGAATNDPTPAVAAGDIANPVFAIVPVFDSLIEPALDVVPLELMGKIVHGEQDFRFHRPIRPGDVLTSRGKMTGWQTLPNGTVACVNLECRDDRGELVNEQHVTFVVRGFQEGGTVGELSPKHTFDEALLNAEPVAEVEQHIDEDQTFRYGPAAGDPMPIHLDGEFAVEMGLPGIIAHGLCTQAFTAWAAVQELAGGDVARIRRHAVRFAKPVLPGQDVRTTFYASGAAGGVQTYAFQSVVDGELVIKDGLVEIVEED